MFGIFATNDVDSAFSADRLLGVLQGSVSRTTRIATEKVKRTDSKRGGNGGGGRGSTLMKMIKGKSGPRNNVITVPCSTHTIF